MQSNQSKMKMSILTIGGWFNTFQRPQHFARLFRKHFHVTVANNHVSIPYFDSPYMVEQHNIVDSIVNIYLSRGSRIKVVGRINSFLYNFQFKKNLGKPAFLNSDVVYTWNVHNIEYLNYVKGKVVIYDAMDDWSEFSSYDHDSAIANELEVVKRADIVLCASEKIHQRLLKHNKKAVLVRNGVDYAYFSLARNYIKKPSDILYPYMDRTIVGYMGHIHDWVDVDLIINVASTLSEVIFVIIGPGLPDLTDRFKSCKNILYLGHKSYFELVSYLSYFKAGIIPFKLNVLNESTNPIKLYEYLGAGLPVVSTGLNEVKLYQQEGVVYVADAVSDFVACINDAIAASDHDEMIKKRMVLAANNSWLARFEVVHNEIRRCLPDL